MRFAAAVLIAVAASAVVSAQDSADVDLARRLANRETRQDAILAIRESKTDKVPLLLSWTENPPTGIYREEFFIGLADAFGELRTKESIPFLIRHIGLTRSMTRPNIWLKGTIAIQGHLVAAGALIKIGPEASKALVKIPWEQRSQQERLAAIFVVARIGDPGARDFLSSAVWSDRHERYWADEGLKLIDYRAKQ